MPDKKVVIIGAGLSGLVAAYRLQKNMPDLKITVLEANSYPGGRMFTTDFGGEGGGESIGFYYNTLHEIAKEVGVEIDYAPMTILNKLFNIAYYWTETNEWVQQKDWVQWKNNPLPPQYRNTPPIMLLRSVVDKIPKPEWDKILDDPLMKKLAGQSLLDFLAEQKVPKEALPFIESNFEVHDMKKTSAFISVLKTWLTNMMANSRYYYVKDGNQNLPRAIAKQLKDIQYNKTVASVKSLPEGHEITTSDGAKYYADYVIFSTPAKPMSAIKIDPPLSGIQKEAFEKIQYTPSVKVFFKVNEPFWEKDQLPLFMWTDTEINMVIPVYDQETRESPISGPKLWGLYTISNGLRANKLYEIEKNGTSIPEYLKGLLEKIRPSMKGCLENVQMVDWGRLPTAQGAFHYYEPDSRIPDYYKNIAKSSHNRFFAGEHTEYLHRGFDAAVEAGLRSAREVSEAIVNQKVIIIGSGNLGKELAEIWKKKFYQMRLTTTTPSKVAELSPLSSDVTVLKVDEDPQNFEKLQEAIRDRDIIVCLLGPSPGKAVTPDQMEKHYTETLLTPARLIAKALEKMPDRKPHVVFTSALNVYGTGEQESADVITEKTAPSPTNISARIYHETEQVYGSLKVPVTILRLGALYNHHQLAFIHQAKMAVEKMGCNSPFDAEGYFLKLHIEDAAKAIDFSIEKKLTGIFNVCEEKQEKIGEFFDKLCARNQMPTINHLGMVKSPRKKISCQKIKNYQFELAYPKALIFGSGELASYLIPALLDEGFHVTVTTTTPEKIPALKKNKVDAIIVEGRDRQAVQQAMDGKEIVVFSIAPQKKRIKSFDDKEALYQVVEETYKITTQNIVRGWQNLTAKPKVVYVSAHTVYPDTNGGVVDEKTPALPRHPLAGYLKDAENNIIEWIPDSAALRMGWLLSQRRNWKHTLELWKKFLPAYELPGRSNIRANMVHIDDAVRSIIFMIKNDLHGIFNVCNDAHPYWGELFDIVAEQAGIDPPNWNPNVKDEWFEGDHTVSNKKIKEAGFTFHYPRELGLSFVVQTAAQQKQDHLISAMITAWVRSIENQRPNGLFKDPFAEKLTNFPALEFLTLRTSLFDQAILESIKTLPSNCQVVMLGSGMDARAFRLEALADIPIFELDLPHVIEGKKQFLAAQNIKRCKHHLLEADLSEEGWMKTLKRAGFKENQPTLWIAEGFITYIKSDSAISLLRNMNKLSHPGSIILLDLPKKKDPTKQLRIEFASDEVQDLFYKSGWSDITQKEPNTPEQIERAKIADQQINVYTARKKRNILILGCGYFGMNYLNQKSNDSRLAFYASTTHQERVPSIKKIGAQDVLVWNGTDEKILKDYLAISDTVITSIRSPLHRDEEILGAMKLVAANLEPRHRLIHLSSIEVYSPNANGVEEEADPSKTYTKIENLFSHHANKCIIRLGQLFGGKIIPESAMMRDHPMKSHLEKIFHLTKGTLPGSGNIPVHLTHLNDLIAFVNYLIEHDNKGIYNLSYSLPLTRKEFYDKLSEHYKMPFIKWDSALPVFPQMLLPQKIDLSKLGQLPFNINVENYTFERVYSEV